MTTKTWIWDSNPDWYGFDEKTEEFYLKDTAPKEAREDYEKWLKYCEWLNKTGYVV